MLILGAGPAGLGAALRLLAWGHRVALVDALALPRPQIGEALTGGLPGLIDSLGASSALADLPTFRDLSVWRRWGEGPPERLDPSRRGQSQMVERGAWDAALLRLAVDRGLDLLPPARAELRPDGQVLLDGEPQPAGQIIDARGRRAPGPRLETGCPALALWVDGPEPGPAATCIEARPEGWLWGAPLPGGGRRTLALLDPGPEAALRLHQLCTGAQLFRPPPPQLPLRGSPATSTLQLGACPPRCWRAGDAALTIDPLSSSGVEVALRHGLQVAAALHSVACGGEEALARTFLRRREAETVLRHAEEARHHYQSADAEGPFWTARRDRPLPEPPPGWAADWPRPPSPAPTPLDPRLAWELPLLPCPQLSIVQEPCLLEERVALASALDHPSLPRPVAFLGATAIASLLAPWLVAPAPLRLPDLMHRWAPTLGGPGAARVASWLLQRGLLRSAGPGPGGVPPTG